MRVRVRGCATVDFRAYCSPHTFVAIVTALHHPACETNTRRFNIETFTAVARRLHEAQSARATVASATRTRPSRYAAQNIKLVTRNVMRTLRDLHRPRTSSDLSTLQGGAASAVSEEDAEALSKRWQAFSERDSLSAGLSGVCAPNESQSSSIFGVYSQTSQPVTPNTSSEPLPSAPATPSLRPSTALPPRTPPRRILDGEHGKGPGDPALPVADGLLPASHGKIGSPLFSPNVGTPSLTPRTPGSNGGTSAEGLPGSSNMSLLAPMSGTPPGSANTSTFLSSSAQGPLDLLEIRALRAKFAEQDSDRNGLISKTDFYALFSSLFGLPEDITEKQRADLLEFTYSLFTASGERELTLKEFIAGCIVLGRGTETERLRYLFQMYDVDRNGGLSLSELERVFYVMRSYATARKDAQSCGDEFGVGCDDCLGSDMSDVAARAMRAYDIDGDGIIEFEDFAKWCADQPSVKAWIDTLSIDTARGMTRLREEREREMLLKELSNLGFGDNQFWRDSFSLVDAANTSATLESGVLPTSAQHPSEWTDPLRNQAPTSSLTVSSQATVDDDYATRSDESHARASSVQSSSTGRENEDRAVHVLRSASGRLSPFEIDFLSLNLVGKIGEGSFATVWRGKWLDTDVAVKVLKSGPKLRASPSFGGSPGLVTAEQGSTSDNKSGVPDSAANYGGIPSTLDDTLEPALASNSGTQGNPAVQQSIADGATFTSDRDRNQFLREIGLLTSLRHPNVLLLMGACTDPRYPLCIVSELVEGGSLYSYLHGSPSHKLSNSHALNLALDIARGMLYLHSSAPIVLHRDLKSQNILVENMEDEEISKAKIIDFGLSRLDSATDSRIGGVGGGLCGSLMTMAPEVMRSEMYQPASDVYSFGVILGEMFSGRIPFGNSNAVQLMYSVSVRGKRPDLGAMEGKPPGIHSLIQDCWAQEPDDRPDFTEVVRRLNEAQQAIEHPSA